MFENKMIKSNSVAVLGFGAVVEKFYLPADKIGPGAERIKFIIDPKNNDRLQDLGSIRYIKKTYSEGLLELKEMKCRPESVYIALPNWMHVDASILALEYGFNVLCEKPMAFNIADCNLLDGVVNRSAVKYAVGMNRRFLPDIQILKNLIDQRVFGEIKTVKIQHGSYYSWYSRTGTYFDPRSHGALADMGVHYLDLLLYLLGDIEPCQYSDDNKGGIESHFFYQLKCKEIKIELEVSRKYKLKNVIKINGELGEAVVDVGGDSGVSFKSSKQPGLRSLFSLDKEKNTIDPLVLAFSQQFESFERYLKNKNSEVATFNDGKKVAHLIEWAYGNKQSIFVFDTQSHLYEKSADSKIQRLSNGHNILVTGGSGFIGGKLVNRLTSGNFNKLTVPVRSYMTMVELSNYNIDTPLINTFDYKTCLQLTKNKNTVFHLAYGKSSIEAKEVTINGTKNLLKAAAKNRVKSVVVLSTYSVFGRPVDEIQVDETFPYKPNLGYYGKTKATMEKWVLDFAKKNSAMNIVVLNPTCVWGPDSGTYVNLPFHLLNEKKFCLIDGERSVGNLVFVENLIDAMILVAEKEGVSGRRFIVNDISLPWSVYFGALFGCKKENISNYSQENFNNLTMSKKTGFKDLIKALVASDHLRNVVKNNPMISPLVKLFWTDGYKRVIEANQSLNSLNNKDFPPPWLLDIFPVAESTFSSARLRALTGWKPAYSFESAMDITKKWLVSSGHVS